MVSLNHTNSSLRHLLEHLSSSLWGTPSVWFLTLERLDPPHINILCLSDLHFQLSELPGTQVLLTFSKNTPCEWILSLSILYLDHNILAITGKIILYIKLIDMGIVVIVPEHPWGYFTSDEVCLEMQRLSQFQLLWHNTSQEDSVNHLQILILFLCWKV